MPPHGPHHDGYLQRISNVAGSCIFRDLHRQMQCVYHCISSKLLYPNMRWSCHNKLTVQLLKNPSTTKPVAKYSRPHLALSTVLPFLRWVSD